MVSRTISGDAHACVSFEGCRLTELLLDQLNQLKFEQQPAKLSEASHMFRAFLEQHRDDLDPATTEALISSHGKMMALLYSS